MLWLSMLTLVGWWIKRYNEEEDQVPLHSAALKAETCFANYQESALKAGTGLVFGPRKRAYGRSRQDVEKQGRIAVSELVKSFQGCTSAQYQHTHSDAIASIRPTQPCCPTSLGFGVSISGGHLLESSQLAAPEIPRKKIKIKNKIVTDQFQHWICLLRKCCNNLVVCSCTTLSTTDNPDSRWPHSQSAHMYWPSHPPHSPNNPTRPNLLTTLSMFNCVSPSHRGHHWQVAVALEWRDSPCILALMGADVSIYLSIHNPLQLA